MPSRRTWSLAAVPLFLLAACNPISIRHSVPRSPTPNRVTGSGQKLEAFVDQHGTFYPDNWADSYGRPRLTGGFVLAERAKRRGKQAQLQDEQTRILNSVEASLADKRRVFVLVHGFNNDEPKARKSYEEIENAISLQPSDAVIEFYWDGLVGPNVNALAVWFPATGYSQLAGSRGLRGILNRIHGKDVFIVAHSRGASVTLSALSDPPYSPSFAADTKACCQLDVFANPPLRDNQNSIRVVLLAPAVGYVDFRSRDFPADTTFRPLNPQVKQIVHTVNTDDPVLKKYLGGRLPNGFNATDLGLRFAVAEAIAAHYPVITHADFSGMRHHGFYEYVTNPRFRDLLRSVGVQTR